MALGASLMGMLSWGNIWISVLAGVAGGVLAALALLPPPVTQVA